MVVPEEVTLRRRPGGMRKSAVSRHGVTLGGDRASSKEGGMEEVAGVAGRVVGKRVSWGSRQDLVGRGNLRGFSLGVKEANHGRVSHRGCDGFSSCPRSLGWGNVLAMMEEEAVSSMRGSGGGWDLGGRRPAMP